MIRKVVIPAAGLGTRLLPITKELPKEMLPIFLRDNNDKICLKPMLQAVFEQLYGAGFRDFGFVVGRGKRAIEDHFTPDYSFIEYLKNNNRARLAYGLQEFYNKVNNSSIVFINQPTPKGFGDAIYKGKSFTQNDPFLLHAGDDLVFSRNDNHLRRMVDAFDRHNADVVFLVEEVKDPRRYGVMVGHEIELDVFAVEEVIEKPKKPPSNFAIIALYIFKPIIYKAIEQVECDEGGEIQIADAIQVLIEQQCKLYALKLRPEERRIDIGTPESYLKTLKGILEIVP